MRRISCSIVSPRIAQAREARRFFAAPSLDPKFGISPRRKDRQD
jgi:hypothetical protein